MRTSEALAKETQTLKPQSAAGNPMQEAQEAERHRRLGEQDEKNGDPLAAVHEEETATRLDPSEENYFAWGSELLLHRAIWQAAEVFRNGANAHPASARMLTGLGAALFAAARYDEAADRLCQASDLNPAAPEPLYLYGPDTHRLAQTFALPATAAGALCPARASQCAGALFLRHGAFAKDPRAETLLARAVEIDPAMRSRLPATGNSCLHQA